MAFVLDPFKLISSLSHNQSIPTPHRSTNTKLSPIQIMPSHRRNARRPSFSSSASSSLPSVASSSSSPSYVLEVLRKGIVHKQGKLGKAISNSFGWSPRVFTLYRYTPTPQNQAQAQQQQQKQQKHQTQPYFIAFRPLQKKNDPYHYQMLVQYRQKQKQRKEQRQGGWPRARAREAETEREREQQRQRQIQRDADERDIRHVKSKVFPLHTFDVRVFQTPSDHRIGKSERDCSHNSGVSAPDPEPSIELEVKGTMGKVIKCLHLKAESNGQTMALAVREYM